MREPGRNVFHSRFNWPAFAQLLPRGHRRTLDLGCGEGRLGALLAARPVVGVDAVPRMAELAAATGDYEEVVVADAGALPFEADAFDLVVAYMSLHDMDDPGAAVAEAARVLRADGRLCLAIPHPMSTAHLGSDAEVSYFAERDYAEAGDAFTFHGRHRPLEAWVGDLRRAGLVVEALREPRPSSEAVRDAPVLAKAQARPPFLHIRASRARVGLSAR